MNELPQRVRREQLLRPSFGMYRFRCEGDDPIELHLPHGRGEPIALLHSCGPRIDESIEVRTPADRRAASPPRRCSGPGAGRPRRLGR